MAHLGSATEWCPSLYRSLIAEAEAARDEGRDHETAEVLLARVKAESDRARMAKRAHSPTSTPPVEAQVEARRPAGTEALREAAEAGARTTPRELPSWFGQKRRGAVVVERVLSALAEVGAATEPDFAEAGFDDAIRLVWV